jgi:hypothetical protein
VNEYKKAVRLRVALPALTLILAVVAAASCASAPVPYVSVIDAYTIVRQNASDAFEVGFDSARDRSALQLFLDRTSDSKDREALTKAWQTVPELKTMGSEFLAIKVFELAVQERKWPKEAPPEVVYVRGVRDAAAAFLKGGSK